MNAHNSPQHFSPAVAQPGRLSTQIRAEDPLANPESPHRRAVEMAKAMQEIAAANGAATYKDLVRHGFTSAEIIEFSGQAQTLAAQWKSDSRSARTDTIEEMAIKVRQPVPNRPPMTENFMTSPQFFEAWGRYCASRAALLLDPWAAQRERCIAVLHEFLNLLPLLPAERSRLIQAADRTLPKIAVRNGRAAA